MALPLTAALGHTFTLDKFHFLKHIELTLNGVDRLLSVSRQSLLGRPADSIFVCIIGKR